MNLPTVSERGAPDMTVPQNSLEEIIRLESVSVSYQTPSERIRTFKEYVIRRLQGRIRYNAFLALDSVSLQVDRGEIFGIIGPNGSGKSTMLKLIARVLKPTAGRVVVRGHVAPLLAVSAGFHPELTGRENVFLNGALLGYTQQEMEDKFQRIVEFAELMDFIDAPMRTYSSGMWARLGFAVATDTQPDILIVDEVLAVGDEAFRRKSEARMRTFMEQGTTILFVSHSMPIIRSMCQRVMWLQSGKIRQLGPADEVCDAYLDSLGS